MPNNKVSVFAKKKSEARSLSQSRVSDAQVNKAVSALLNFVEREKEAKKTKNLIDEAEVVSLMVTLFKTPAKGSNKGIRIDIPHTLHPVDETRTCLIVKDDAVKPLKESLSETLSLGGVDKILSLTKLRTRFKDHQQKRELCDTYDLFLADDRILPMLTKALGREFFKQKKQPRPVHVLRKNLAKQIQSARDSTRLYLGWGNCSAVRVARTDMTKEQVAENLTQSIAEVGRIVPKGWKAIQALHIKTPDSVALPLYNAVPTADTAELIEAHRKTKQPTQKKKNNKKKAIKNNKDKTLTKSAEKKPQQQKKKRKQAEEPTETEAAAPKEESPKPKRSRRQAQKNKKNKKTN